MKSLRYILISSLTILLFSNLFAVKKTVDADGGSEYTTLASAISAASSGDTIYIQGADVDSYDETWPDNINTGNLTFMGANTDPDNFHTIRLSGGQWSNWWNNNSGDTRFENLVLNDVDPFVMTNNDRNIFLKNVVVKNTDNDIFTLSGDRSEIYINVDNAIFWGNSTIFKAASNQNVNGPYGNVFNSTFYNNSTVYSSSIDAASASNGKYVDFTNCIFKGNTTIADVDITPYWTYCVIPTSENTSNWGTGYVSSDDPGFVVSPSVNSDFQVSSGSVSDDAGTNTNAPATDIAGNSREGTYDIGAYEAVTPANSNPTDIFIDSDNIDENNTNGDIVGTLSTTDADTGDTHIYTLVTGTGDTDNGSFSISGDSLNSGAIFDFETKSSYTVRVQTDDGNGGTYQKAFTISINDLNDNNPIITTSQSFDITEDIANTVTVGTVVATDADTVTTFSNWAETGGTGESIFEINDSTGVIAVTDNSNIDYETTTSYTYTVTVSDGTNTSAEETITINITDVNEAPTAEDISTSTEVNKTKKIILLGSDVDAGNTLTYEIVANSTNGSVSISGDTAIYVPATDYTGSDNFTYKAIDNDSLESNISTVSIDIDAPTATGELIENNSDKLIIYPNPVINIANIKSSINGIILIMNLNEKVVGIVKNNKINLSNLKKGIYFAIIKEDGKIKALKKFYKR